jgi:hypothetical protein
MEKVTTTNFYLASAFIALGYNISSLDRSDCKHIKFEFDNDPGLIDIQRQWDDKSLTVNARDFAEAIREVKMKIHQD